jgi:hypothetical protein
MVLSALRRLAALAPLLTLAGCLHRTPLARFDQPTPLAVTWVLERREGAQLTELPAELDAALHRELERRNLTPEPVSGEARAPLAKTHFGRGRVELLTRALGPHHVVLLVELKATFFGQFDGGYKWTVDAQISVVDTDAPADATVETASVPAFLERESQGQLEALQSVADALAEKAGAAIDDHFAGRLTSAPAAVAPPQGG